MALLSTSQLTKSFGTDVIFSGVSFEIQKNDRVGLVGINGSGKTTLFKVLMDEYSADSGEIYKARDCVIGYMEQHVCRDLHRSAYHEVLTVFSHLSAMEERLDTINKALQGRPENPQALLEEQFRLNEQFDREGGLTYKSRARSTLLGLGFTDEQMGAPIGVLSGGQKAKLQLAKMLLSGANLLLLDEPTNHLDIDSCEALEDALFHYDGTLLIVSHDRYLINKLADRIYYLEDGGITEYLGNYDDFLQARREKEEAARQNEEKAAPKINLYKQRKEQEAELRRMRTAVRKTEERIEETDEAMAACAQALQEPDTAADFEKAMELSARMEELRRENDRLMAEWEALSAQLEEKEKAALS